MKQRLAPFLILLDARYLPLLLLAVPQSFVISFWLFDSYVGKRGDVLAIIIACFGFLAFEFSYVGSIAWASSKTGVWFWLTALTALAFSVAVAIYAHWQADSFAAILHAGFPLTAFAYTMTIHKATTKNSPPQTPVETIKPDLTVQTFAADSSGGIPVSADSPLNLQEIREAFKRQEISSKTAMELGVNPSTVRGWQRTLRKEMQ